ncbi:MAG: hypothetical protein ABJP89_19605 [Lentilitoribacter sp.]
MKTLAICVALVWSGAPSALLALTMEELRVVLDYKQIEKVEEIPADFHSWMLQLLEPAIAIEDADDRYFAMDAMLQFFYIRNARTARNAIDEYAYAGIPITVEKQDELYNFAHEMELQFARQIIETGSEIEQSRAEIARLREANRIKEIELNRLREEAAAQREEAAAQREEFATFAFEKLLGFRETLIGLSEDIQDEAAAARALEAAGRAEALENSIHILAHQDVREAARAFSALARAVSDAARFRTAELEIEIARVEGEITKTRDVILQLEEM